MVRRATPEGYGPFVIRITRPTEPPAVLAEKGTVLVREMRTRYQEDPHGYREGSKTFAFAQEVYGHPEVKERLATAQHHKCCYCEVWVVSEHGDIEHFRPKARVRQEKGQPHQVPGYFWLAYAWTNLLYACSRCNRDHKKDLFPLVDPTTRADALRGEGSTETETPLLLNPTTENPENHIRFDAERAEPLNGDGRGRVTIDVLGLNRVRLLEARRERLERVRGWVDCLRFIRTQPDRFLVDTPEGQTHLRMVCQQILNLTSSSAPFSAMVRHAVRQWLAPDLEFPCSESALMTWALSGSKG